MKPLARTRVSIPTIRIRRLLPPQISMDRTPSDRAQRPPARTRGGWLPLRPARGGLAHMDRRGWMAVGVIAAGAAVVGGAMGAGVHRMPLFSTVLMAAMVVSVARAGWGWLRGRSRRARLREGLLSRAEAYGGGVYGTGAGITLVMLSAASLQAEWARASGVGDFLRGMTLQFWLGFSAESILNAVWAGLWPLFWFTHRGVTAALAVAAAAWVGDALADAWRVAGRWRTTAPRHPSRPVRTVWPPDSRGGFHDRCRAFVRRRAWGSGPEVRKALPHMGFGDS